MKQSYPRVKRKQRCENCRLFSPDENPTAYAGAPSSDGWCNLPKIGDKRRRASSSDWCDQWRKKDD